MNILNRSLDELKEALGTDLKNGLSQKGVADNTSAFGHNVPFNSQDGFFLSFFKSLLSDVMPWLFLGICILSLLFNRSASITASAVLFFIYIALRLLIYVYISSIDKKINSYRKISATVIRNGKKQNINAKNLVPGDILILSSGDFVPCDGIVIEADSLYTFESFITSNPNPVAKKPQSAINESDPYHACILFTGSAIVQGTAKVLVCHTARNIFNIKNGPLKKVFTNEMPKIYKNNIFVGKQLYLLWILMCFVIFTIGVLLKYDVLNMLFMAVTLSLAALGDCIPLFSEAAIFSSVYRLKKKHACILKNYKAIDTFNSTDTVFIENFNYFLSAMPEVKSFYVNNDFRSPSDINPYQRDMLLKYALASISIQPKTRRYTDISLIRYAATFGITKKSVENEFMYLNKHFGDINAVLTFRNGEYSVISHGFAADMLSRCNTMLIHDSVCEIGRNERFALLNHIHNMELNSQTVIAIVKKSVVFSSENRDCFVDLDRMTLVGFIGFYNPISAEAVKSLSLCKKNGINVVLMENAPTGAYMDMAQSTSLLEDGDLVADENSINKTDAGLFRAELKRYKIFSRLSQPQRLNISKLYKENDSIITCLPNTLADIPTQAAADASITAYDEKLPALNYFSDALLLNKNFSVFTALIKHCRAIYHNTNRMLLYILTNQFLLCTIIMLGMTIEKRLIFNPTTLLIYGIFAVFPSALALSCDVPPADKPLPPPNYRRYMFHLVSLIPPPLIVGLTGGIVTVLVHRMYSSSPEIASGASLLTLFSSSYLTAISLRSDELFSFRKLSALFTASFLLGAVSLILIFTIKPLSTLLIVNVPNFEVAFISLVFSLIPFAISEIIKKAKNLTK